MYETPQQLVTRLQGEKFADVYQQINDADGAGGSDWDHCWPVVDGEFRLTGEVIPLRDATKDWRFAIGDGGRFVCIDGAEARAHGWSVGPVLAQPP